MKKTIACIGMVSIIILSAIHTYQAMEQDSPDYHGSRSAQETKVQARESRRDNPDYIPEEVEPYLANGSASDVSANADALTLYAKAAALLDADSGRVLYEKDANTRYPMASTTKIMTCIYALENSNLTDVVTISSRAASQPQTRLGIKEGEQYALKDLLYALMLQSCNDCAVAIAEHVSGSVEAFCQEMTVKARELGLSDTAFQTPNGLDADGHYTTAAELCKIGAYAIQNEDFLEITNTADYTFTELTKGARKQVSNKNAFLTMYSGAIGIKTGYTSKASYCFVGAVERDGITLVSAVLASGWYPKKTYKWSDTKQLMDYGYNHYKQVKLLNPSASVASVPVLEGIETQVTVAEQESITTLLKSGDRVSYELDLRASLLAPVPKDYVAGTLNIKINGSVYKKVALYTQESAREWNPRWVFRVTLLKFISNF